MEAVAAVVTCCLQWGLPHAERRWCWLLRKER